MSVKVIEKTEFSAKNGGSKQDLLAADIREIINNRIEYCELEDFPYSAKTSMSDIMAHMTPVFADEFRKESGVLPKGYSRRYWESEWRPPFIMKKVIADDGLHVYGTFYVKNWERQIKEAKEGK